MTPTIQDAARAIAARTLSPVELTQRMLTRIRAQDGTLHAFTEVTQARALADARAAEARAMAGTLRGPLDGIPIAHKDIFATAGIATTGCSRQLAGWLPRGDAAAVAAGLVLGGLLSAADYVQAVRQRGALCRATAAAMAGLDLLLLATQPEEAPLMQEAEGSLSFQKPDYTMPFNVTGQPAISLPAGFGAGGLPMAVQLAARPWQEPLLFRAAHALQAATPWRGQRPAAA